MRARSRRRPGISVWVVLIAGLLGPGAAPAADLLAEQGCTGCHATSAPADGERSLADWVGRKAPDLFYAGAKFRPEWLRRWLARPTRIRPAGMAPTQHTRTVDGQDELVADDLPEHPRVAEDDLDAVVEALVALRWGGDRLPESLPSAPPVPPMLARLNFVKFKGCGSCHMAPDDFGGFSGPQLYTVAHRLQPGFLWSYIADPQAWDPLAPMPGYGLRPVEVGKLVQYLNLLAEESNDAADR
ncbi:MAG: hypothetical protein ACQGVK_03995 [Myxococcota bacterium]